MPPSRDHVHDAHQGGSDHRRTDAEGEADGQQAGSAEAERATPVDLDRDELEDDRQAEKREQRGRALGGRLP
jgi:hypothetical protein